MRKESRTKYNAFLKRQAELNEIPLSDVGNKFAVTEPVEQILEDKIQESSSFLQLINIVPIIDISGEKIGLGIGSTLASTTDTTAQARITIDPSNMDAVGYICTQTNFDSHIRYAKLDLWARYKNFQTRWTSNIIKRIALDRQLIAWNGVSRAATSNRVANPLLQDVNKGWIQKARENNLASVLSEVVGASGQVTIGIGGDYRNLDAAVLDATNNLVDPWYTEDTEMVVILGRQLMADKYFPIVNSDNAPTEALALDMLMSQKRVGGLRAVRVPGFPANSFCITRLDNLSIYRQEGSRRRSIKENPDWDRIDDFQAVNEAYVVEDHGGFAVVENITFL